jgi:hypothetical protein
MRRLSSAREVIDALGGVPAVSVMTGANLKAIYHWIAVGVFPPRFYCQMQDALERVNAKASPRLWSMVGYERGAA